MGRKSGYARGIRAERIVKKRLEKKGWLGQAKQGKQGPLRSLCVERREKATNTGQKRDVKSKEEGKTQASKSCQEERRKSTLHESR